MTEPWADGPPPNRTPPGLPPEEKPQGIGPWILAGVICTAAVIAVVIAVIVVVNGDDKKSASDSKAGAGSSSQGSSSSSAPTSSSQPAPNTSGDAPQSPTTSSAPSSSEATQTPVAPTNKQTTEPTDEPQDSGALGIVDACNQASSAQSQKISTNPSVGISSGQAVYVMTSLLYYVGYTDVASSSFSSSMESNVIAYQESRGLFADGIVGPDTWGQLISDAC